MFLSLPLLNGNGTPASRHIEEDVKNTIFTPTLVGKRNVPSCQKQVFRLYDEPMKLPVGRSRRATFFMGVIIICRDGTDVQHTNEDF